MNAVTKIIETKRLKHNGKAVASIVLAALAMAAVLFLYLVTLTMLLEKDPYILFDLPDIILKGLIPTTALVLTGQILGVISLYGQKNAKATFSICLSTAVWVLTVLLALYILKITIDNPFFRRF
jgi:uncharacterized membrane protein